MKSTIAAFVAVLAAGGVTAAEDTHRLSGTLSLAAAPEGAPVYFKLIEASQACTDPGPGLQAGTSAFESGEASYELATVGAGDYQLCFLFDPDENVLETQGATPGDYGALRSVSVDGDTTLDVLESDWVLIP